MIGLGSIDCQMNINSCPTPLNPFKAHTLTLRCPATPLGAYHSRRRPAPQPQVCRRWLAGRQPQGNLGRHPPARRRPLPHGRSHDRLNKNKLAGISAITASWHQCLRRECTTSWPTLHLRHASCQNNNRPLQGCLLSLRSTLTTTS